MPYSKKHKQESRLRILESAADHFLHKGYDEAGINDIMRDAGMTRGAFYAHFESKGELYEKAMLHAAAKGRMSEHRLRGLQGAQWLSAMLEGYLSSDHIEGEASPCPLAFLISDIANRDPQVRKTYTRIYKYMNQAIEKHRDQGRDRQDSQILALTAMMVGGVALSRVVSDKGLAQRILSNCRQTADGLLDLQG